MPYEQKMVKTQTTCRSCQQQDIESFLDLGRTPPADVLLTEEQLGLPELTPPLEVVF